MWRCNDVLKKDHAKNFEDLLAPFWKGLLLRNGPYHETLSS